MTNSKAVNNEILEISFSNKKVNTVNENKYVFIFFATITIIAIIVCQIFA